MSKRQFQIFIVLFSIILLAGIYLSKNYVIFILLYVLICIVMLSRSLFVAATLRKRVSYIIRYIVIMILQIVFTALVTFSYEEQSTTFAFFLVISTIIIPAPILIEIYWSGHNDNRFLMPSVQDFKAVTYAQLMYDIDRIKDGVSGLEKTGKAFSKDNMTKIFRQLQGQNSFRYINNGSLTDEYFHQAYASLNDENVYIILTDSGSPASEVISVFTQQRFNHVSLSFDKELLTIISYNGGENIYPPGMNPEMVEWFFKKEDAAVLVYRLKATIEQKKKMIEKIKEINTNGSAYNLMGLLLKYSAKPNIMFCSQFVNQILSYVGLEYLNKDSVDIRPGDFVEMDYQRKLEFVKEIRFNTDDDLI